MKFNAKSLNASIKFIEHLNKWEVFYIPSSIFNGRRFKTSVMHTDISIAVEEFYSTLQTEIDEFLEGLDGEEAPVTK